VWVWVLGNLLQDSGYAAGGHAAEGWCDQGSGPWVTSILAHFAFGKSKGPKEAYL
jgi:hypothetical protein